MIMSKGRKAYQIVINIILLLVSLCMILPLVLLFMSSITDENTLVANGYSFFPAKLSTGLTSTFCKTPPPYSGLMESRCWPP